MMSKNQRRTFGLMASDMKSKNQRRTLGLLINEMKTAFRGRTIGLMIGAMLLGPMQVATTPSVTDSRLQRRRCMRQKPRRGIWLMSWPVDVMLI